MNRLVPHNTGVFAARKSVLAVLVLAGCATAPRHVTPLAEVEGEFAPLPTPPAAPAPRTSAPPAAAPLPARAPVTTAHPSVGQPLNETWVPLQRWSRNNAFSAPVQIAAAPLASYSLHSSNGVFIVRPGSQIALWEGLELHLGFAPQMIDGQPYMHNLDLRKTVQPLLAGMAGITPNTRPIIVIDPGHGGENAGAKSALDEHYEKEFTLDWARRLQSALVTKNCDVFLTRLDDSDLALSNRVAFAAQHKADVFLSLHFNSAAPNQTEAGLETYCLTPAGMPSSLTRGFADETGLAFPNNAFDIQNLQLALQVHRQVLQVNGHDRGVRHARFPGVLRGQARPAVLVEGGYLSNPEEARRIAEPVYRQQLAEAVARALTEALGLSSLPAEARDQRLPNGAQATVQGNNSGTKTRKSEDTAQPVETIPETQ